MDRRGSQLGSSSQYSFVSRPIIGRLNGFFRKFFDENPSLRGGRRIHSIIYDDRLNANISSLNEQSTPSTSQQSEISVDRRIILQLSSFYNDKEAFNDGFNIIGCHDSDQTTAHIHWIHMCPSAISCSCSPKVRAESIGFTVKSRVYGNNNAAEQHFSSAIAYLCKFKRRLLRFTNAGRHITFPKELKDGIETLSSWCQLHPESNVASEMEICAMSRVEPTQSSHENIFGRKRSYAAASASDWKRNKSSDNYLTPAEANKLASNIDAIILKHFPRHVHELNGLDNFKELTKDIFIPFGAKLVQIVDRCWIRISTELQKKTLNEFIEIRKDSYYDLEKFYTLSTSLQLVKHLIQEQFDNDVKSCKEFISRLCNIVDKIEPEKNTICIEGDSNAGKSILYYIYGLKISSNIGGSSSNSTLRFLFAFVFF
ncbi:hypothetical protein BLOT_009809 [Blomia tropicalis]|nr:hypothetical protein BLOT_009809 [Blomia tropicalis]